MKSATSLKRDWDKPNKQARFLQPFRQSQIRRALHHPAKAGNHRLNALAKYHINRDQDSSRFYVENAFELATTLEYDRGVAAATLTKGILGLHILPKSS